MGKMVFIFGTACQIYCYGRYCVTQSVSPKVPENPSGPLVDNFIVLPCVAFGVACVKLLPGVDRWNSLDDPRVIGPCHAKCGGGPVIRQILTGFYGTQAEIRPKTAHHFKWLIRQTGSVKLLHSLPRTWRLCEIVLCYVLWLVVARLLPDTQTIPLRPTEPFVIKLYVCICNLPLVFRIRTTSIKSV